MPEQRAIADNSQEFLTVGNVNVFPKMHKGEMMYSSDDIAKALVQHAETAIPDIRKLALTAADARSAINASIEDLGGSLAQLDRATKDYNTAVRITRMNIVNECSMMVNALKDVRQFFLGPDYDREQKRLADFVDLCERLKKLKDTGFLDTVADTMIRLAAYDKQTIQHT